MLGSDVLVAPVLAAGATTRTLRLPEGVWSYLGKTDMIGGQEVTVSAPIDTLPYFIKK